MLIRPLVAAALTALCLSTASATTVLRLTPAEVESLAHRIIEGRCVEVRATTVGGPEHSMRATEYVFAVERVLKGEGLADQVSRDGGRLVVRQLGGSDAGRGSELIAGMPRYEVGVRYRLALNGESSLGLTSPVGFGQGVTRLPDLATANRPQP